MKTAGLKMQGFLARQWLAAAMVPRWVRPAQEPQHRGLEVIRGHQPAKKEEGIFDELGKKN